MSVDAVDLTSRTVTIDNTSPAQNGTRMLQNTLIDKWWRNHKRFSGEVHLVRADWKLLGSPLKNI